MPDIFETIPGYRDAVEQEKLERDAAFLDLPETICGVTVKPMTIQHMITLSCIGSPFVSGGYATSADARAFISVVSGLGCFGRLWLKFKLWGLDARRAAKEISDYLDGAFLDSPATGSGGSDASYYSNAAALVDFLASQYGWGERECLSVSLRRGFQYIKAATFRSKPNAILFNPSDNVRTKYLLAQKRN